MTSGWAQRRAPREQVLGTGLWGSRDKWGGVTGGQQQGSVPAHGPHNLLCLPAENPRWTAQQVVSGTESGCSVCGQHRPGDAVQKEQRVQAKRGRTRLKSRGVGVHGDSPFGHCIPVASRTTHPLRLRGRGRAGGGGRGTCRWAHGISVSAPRQEQVCTEGPAGGLPEQ